LAPAARVVHGAFTPMIVVFNGAANWLVRRLGIEPTDELTSVRSLEEIEYLIRSSGETGTIAADPAAWGDVVLARRDVPTSYHLAVTIDDAIQKVTDVIRGEDLFAATSVHRLLQHLLGLPAPRYRHHGLVQDRAGRKLSKSDGATSIASLRAQGATPADIIAMAGLASEA